MPLELKERRTVATAHGPGREVLAIHDLNTLVPYLVHDGLQGWTYESRPAELHCFSIEQAEELAPKLMEWLIKRRSAERNASSK